MNEISPTTQRVAGYCALCVSRCGSIALLENERFVALEPDPAHPTGKALCAKGRAAPELVYHPERLLYPMQRTRPKGDPDPGWQRISWDEALDRCAAALRRIAGESGAESVVFTSASPSTSASDDALAWMQRLANAFGSPNFCLSVELCGWGRYFAPAYTFGASVPGVFMPDLEHAGCILYWGYNPNLARLTHATATVEAQRRGARLIVVDPRRTGPASKADIWLQVRPGTDGALALAICHVMIARGWFDRDFVRDWTNAPLLVRADTGHLLLHSDIVEGGNSAHYVAWDANIDKPVVYDPATGRYGEGEVEPALFGSYVVRTQQGEVTCQPVFAQVAALCGAYAPARAEAICGVDRALIEATARMLWEARPVAYYAWSGVEMQTNATQIARAIAQLYVLTGSFDGKGGNVRFATAVTQPVAGEALLPPAQRAKTLGLAARPMGPARWQFVTSEEIYRGILEQQPYIVRGVVGFGANLLLAHADGRRGREALAALDFYVHADLFMNPTAELADIVLPVASAFEREALKVAFEGSQAAASRMQLRPRVVEPRGEARSDMEIVFGLATRLGLGEHFWDGEIEAAYRHQLEPSGVTLEALRAQPSGIDLALTTQHRKFAEHVDGRARGFQTPTGKIELFSQTMLDLGLPALPAYEAPLISHETRPDLRSRFPLILTCAKHVLFCESQQRALPSLRRRAREPEVELHPATAAARGIGAGDWVQIETLNGKVRARARLVDTLQPEVVTGQHGWWQACAAIGAPGYDAFDESSANYNLLINSAAVDPVSGSVPHRAFLCEVRLLG